MAFGIGTSELEHVVSTSILVPQKPRLEGFDEIGMTLKHETQIAAFWARDAAQGP